MVALIFIPYLQVENGFFFAVDIELRMARNIEDLVLVVGQSEDQQVGGIYVPHLALNRSDRVDIAWSRRSGDGLGQLGSWHELADTQFFAIDGEFLAVRNPDCSPSRCLRRPLLRHAGDID